MFRSTKRTLLSLKTDPRVFAQDVRIYRLSITTHQHYSSIKPHEETGRKKRRISSIHKPCGKELINLIINRLIDTRYYDLLNADHKADSMAKCSDIGLPLGGSKPEHWARKR